MIRNMPKVTEVRSGRTKIRIPTNQLISETLEILQSLKALYFPV